MLLAAESLKQLTPKRQRAGSTVLPSSLYLPPSLTLPLSPVCLLCLCGCDGANLIFLFFAPFSFPISPCNECSSPHTSLCLCPLFLPPAPLQQPWLPCAPAVYGLHIFKVVVYSIKIHWIILRRYNKMCMTFPG